MTRRTEWWELEPISFAASRIYKMEDTPLEVITPEPVVVPPAAEAPKTLEAALAQIEELKKTPPVAGTLPDWASKRIDQLTTIWRNEERQLTATRAQLDQAKREIETLKKEGKVVTELPQAVIDEQVNARALEIAKQTAFNESCNKVISAGQKAYPDFSQAVAKLHSISPLMEQTPQGPSARMPPTFIEAMLELDEPHKVLHELSALANNDEAARIMSLPPARQGAALAKFAAKLEPPAVEISKAPPPVKPVVKSGTVSGGHASNDVSNPNLTTAEWMKLRDVQAREAASARRRRA